MTEIFSNDEFLEKQLELQREIDKLNRDEVTIVNIDNIYSKIYFIGYSKLIKTMFFLFQEEIDKQLDNLLAEQVHVHAKLKGIEKMFASLKILQDDGDSFVEAVNKITNSSENVCGKIRLLDVARVSLNLFFI